MISISMGTGVPSKVVMILMSAVSIMLSLGVPSAMIWLSRVHGSSSSCSLGGLVFTVGEWEDSQGSAGRCPVLEG